MLSHCRKSLKVIILEKKERQVFNNMEYLKMEDYPYHFGMKTRIYPSSQQKAIIHYNSECNRFMYNKFVELNNKHYELKKKLDKIPENDQDPKDIEHLAKLKELSKSVKKN